MHSSVCMSGLNVCVCACDLLQRLTCQCCLRHWPAWPWALGPGCWQRRPALRRRARGPRAGRWGACGLETRRSRCPGGRGRGAETEAWSCCCRYCHCWHRCHGSGSDCRGLEKKRSGLSHRHHCRRHYSERCWWTLGTWRLLKWWDKIFWNCLKLQTKIILPNRLLATLE